MSLKLASAILAIGLTSISAPLLAAKSGSDLTAQEQADLTFVREEEKLARDTYLVFFDKWGTAVFSNIAGSEQSHMDAILGLLRRYDLPDPAAGNQIGQFTDPSLRILYANLSTLGMESEMAALRVGGIIEETDIRDLQTSIANTTHPDIAKVYENLYCGSRNHLRAFARSIGDLTGRTYTAVVLTQTEVDTIIGSPTEQCGK